MAIDQSKHMVPQISVLMTSYNSEHYVEEAVRSILKQTLQDYEFIIVDDGSTDHTRERIAAITDSRIRLFFLGHIGRAHALNYAVEKAQSPFIAFMDADDIAMPKRLEKQFQVFQQHPEMGVVSNWYEYIDSHGTSFKKAKQMPEFHDDIENAMTVHCSACFGSTMIRRKLFIQIGGFNKQLHCAEDYDFFLRLLPITKFYNIQESLLQYRIHVSSRSISRRTAERANTLRLANEYLTYRLEQAPSVGERRKILFRIGVNEYYHGTMRSARSWFLKVLPKCWSQWKLWRYFLPSLLGDSLFRIYRSIRNRSIQ
jgi:glycosyltransferase involved in cell wall biosynthesis